MAELQGDGAHARQFEELAQRAQQAYVRGLWNGRYLEYDTSDSTHHDRYARRGNNISPFCPFTLTSSQPRDRQSPYNFSRTIIISNPHYNNNLPRALV